MKPSLLFEWDSVKAQSNLRKHGVSFDEAATVFADPFALTILDAEHSRDEVRELTLGSSYWSRLVVVYHTDRQGRIRIISARKADKGEVAQYHDR